MTEFTDASISEEKNTTLEKPVIAGKTPMLIEVEAGKTYWWCSCGKSANQPFCDGSHKGSSFSPLKWVAETSTKVAFCACKNSHNPPHCDGTHKHLSNQSE